MCKESQGKKSSDTHLSFTFCKHPTGACSCCPTTETFYVILKKAFICSGCRPCKFPTNYGWESLALWARNCKVLIVITVSILEIVIQIHTTATRHWVRMELLNLSSTGNHKQYARQKERKKCSSINPAIRHNEYVYYRTAVGTDMNSYIHTLRARTHREIE